MSIYARNNRKKFPDANKYAYMQPLYVLRKNHKIINKFEKKNWKIKIFAQMLCMLICIWKRFSVISSINTHNCMSGLGQKNFFRLN